jgi:hypothetical protein
MMTSLSAHGLTSISFVNRVSPLSSGGTFSMRRIIVRSGDGSKFEFDLYPEDGSDLDDEVRAAFAEEKAQQAIAEVLAEVAGAESDIDPLVIEGILAARTMDELRDLSSKAWLNFPKARKQISGANDARKEVLAEAVA